MKYLAAAMVLVGLLGGGILALQGQAQTTAAQQDEAATRFEAIHIDIDSGDVPLAAYQFELSAKQGEMKIVGIENGEHPAYPNPPYYDRQAVNNGQADRIIIADFATAQADQLPTGKTRVATIHLQTRGEVTFELVLQAAADPQGQKFQPTISYRKGTD